MACSSITNTLFRLSLLRFTPKSSPLFSSLPPLPIRFAQSKPKNLNRFRLYSMASSEPKESPANNPGLQATPDEATKSYIMQQTVAKEAGFSRNEVQFVLFRL